MVCPCTESSKFYPSIKGNLSKFSVTNNLRFTVLLLQRNGADYAVYVNNGQEFDGSDAGARPDEAVSWGKIKHTANPVKVRSYYSV